MGDGGLGSTTFWGLILWKYLNFSKTLTKVVPYKARSQIEIIITLFFYNIDGFPKNNKKWSTLSSGLKFWWWWYWYIWYIWNDLTTSSLELSVIYSGRWRGPRRAGWWSWWTRPSTTWRSSHSVAGSLHSHSSQSITSGRTWCSRWDFYFYQWFDV